MQDITTGNPLQKTHTVVGGRSPVAVELDAVIPFLGVQGIPVPLLNTLIQNLGLIQVAPDIIAGRFPVIAPEKCGEDTGTRKQNKDTKHKKPVALSGCDIWIYL